MSEEEDIYDTYTHIQTNNTTKLINSKNKTLSVLIENIAKGYNTFLYIMSEDAGLGKSTLTLQTLNKLNTNYEYLQGYITPLELYHFLYRHRNKDVIVLDDLDEALNNKTTLTILKMATWTVGKNRIVSYNTTSKSLEVPKSFILKANVIIISNYIKNNVISKALMSRGLYYEIKLTQKEKLQLIKDFANIPYKNITLNKRKELVDYIINKVKDNYAIKELNYRTVIKLYNIYLQNPKNWKKYAEVILVYDEDLLILINSLQASDTIKEAQKKFTEKTGLSRATFYRMKRKLESQVSKKKV